MNKNNANEENGNNPVEFLKNQKTLIDENIKAISERCVTLRSRRDELLTEKEALLNTHVTVDDFIECISGAIQKKKEYFADQLILSLVGPAYGHGTDFLKHPSYEKMTNEKILSNISGVRLLSNRNNPGEITMESWFYLLNDLMIAGIGQVLKDHLMPGKRVKGLHENPFDTGKPMKEIAARLSEIDGEIDKIDEEVDELIRSAGLFGAAI